MSNISKLSVIFGGDTTQLDKATRSMKRTLNSLKGPIADLDQSMQILNAMVKDGVVTQTQADLAFKKATLSAKKHEDSIKKLTQEYKALTGEQNKAAGLKKQAWFQGIDSQAAEGRTALAARLKAFKAEKAELEKQKKEADSLYTKQLAAARSAMRKYEAEQKVTKELERQNKLERDRVAGTSKQAWFQGIDRQAAEGRAALAARLKAFKAEKAELEKQKKEADSLYTKQLAAARSAMRKYEAEQQAEQKRRQEMALRQENYVREQTQRQERERQAEAQRRADLRATGSSYMSQFDTKDERIARQQAEANRLFKQGAITAKEYEKALRGIRMQNSGLVQGFNEFKGAFSTLVGPLVILTKAIDTFREAVKLAAELDLTRAKLEVFTGSVFAASRQMAELRRMSSTMSLSFQGMAKGAGTMMGFGVDPGQVSKYLSMIGKIAAGDNQRFEALVLAFSQMQAAGRLMGQELLQMVNAGFNPLKIISEETGVSMAQLKKEMEAGAMGAERIVRAFESATSAGGAWEKMSDKMRTTFAGSISSLKNEWEQFLTWLVEKSALSNDFRFASAGAKRTRHVWGEQPNTRLASLEREIEQLDIEMAEMWGLPEERAAETLRINQERERLEKEIEHEKKFGKLVDDETAMVARGTFEQDTADMDKNSIEYLKKKKELQSQIGLGNMDNLALTPEELARLEEAEKHVLNMQRASEAFNDSIKGANERAINIAYGDDAVRVHAMLQASVDAERKLIEGMIAQKKTADEIAAATNTATQAKDAELKKQLELNAAAEKQAIAEEKKEKEEEDWKSKMRLFSSLRLRTVQPTAKTLSEFERQIKEEELLSEGHQSHKIAASVESNIRNQEKLISAIKERLTLESKLADLQFRASAAAHGMTEQELLAEKYRKEMTTEEADALAKEETKAKAIQKEISLREKAAELNKDPNDGVQQQMADLEVMRGLDLLNADAYEREVRKIRQGAASNIPEIGLASSNAVQSQNQFKMAIRNSEVQERLVDVALDQKAIMEKIRETMDLIRDNVGIMN